MKIARKTCQSSCRVLIDRMMRCKKQWHYGLSRRDKAVSRAILRRSKTTPEVIFRERGKRAKKGLGKGASSRIDYDTLPLTLRG